MEKVLSIIFSNYYLYLVVGIILYLYVVASFILATPYLVVNTTLSYVDSAKDAFDLSHLTKESYLKSIQK